MIILTLRGKWMLMNCLNYASNVINIQKRDKHSKIFAIIIIISSNFILVVVIIIIYTGKEF